MVKIHLCEAGFYNSYDLQFPYQSQLVIANQHQERFSSLNSQSHSQFMFNILDITLSEDILLLGQSYLSQDLGNHCHQNLLSTNSMEYVTMVLKFHLQKLNSERMDNMDLKR